jgi:hypothetical protein
MYSSAIAQHTAIIKQQTEKYKTLSNFWVVREIMFRDHCSK